MNYEFLICEIENRVAIVTINRPPVNPLNTQVFHELSVLFGELEANEEVRVIVLTGSGRKAFVAGADINEMAALDLVGVNKMNKTSRTVFSKIENMSKPVIAAINGLALAVVLNSHSHVTYVFVRIKQNSLFQKWDSELFLEAEVHSVFKRLSAKV